MPKSILSDMDGVIYRGKSLVEGAKDFIRRLLDTRTPFLFLTNNSEQTPIDLLRRLEGMGIEGLTEQSFYTSAMATAAFLSSQKPRGSAYLIGGNSMANELYKVGYSLTETNPDYVVVGKTTSFNFDMLRKALRLIDNGAKFIATNPDVVDPAENGREPASGAILAAIEVASGKKLYVVGKPNALMMMSARKQLGSHSSDTVMIGDRMDTDIVAGLEAGMTTCLVLSGVSTRETLDQFPYRPDHVFGNVGEIDPLAL